MGLHVVNLILQNTISHRSVDSLSMPHLTTVFNARYFRVSALKLPDIQNFLRERFNLIQPEVEKTLKP